MHFIVVPLLLSTASAACPEPAALDALAASATRAELISVLRDCAGVAERRGSLMAAAAAVLSSAPAEAGAIGAAAQAVLASGNDLAPPPAPPPTRHAASAPAAPAAPAEPAAFRRQAEEAVAKAHGHTEPSSPESARNRAKLVEALEAELARRAADGAVGTPRPSGREAVTPPKLTTWHDSVAEQQQAQLAQARAVRARWREGKPEERVPAQPAVPLRRWAVACDAALYGLGLPAVAQCTPGVPSASHQAMGCARVLRDDFISKAEQVMLVRTMERTMRGLFHQGGQTSFAPEAKSAPRHMGERGHALFVDVQRRVRQAIEQDFGLPRLFSAGTLLIRIWADDRIPEDGMDIEPGHKYHNPHVDKANRASYDYSALLYLNTHCAEGSGGGCDYDDPDAPDFDGGTFAWIDEARDHVVEPRGGRLLTFTGGLENAHHGRHVSRGTRYVIGFWFTCHAELEYQDEDSDGDSGGGGGGGGGELEGGSYEVPKRGLPVGERECAAGEVCEAPAADASCKSCAAGSAAAQAVAAARGDGGRWAPRTALVEALDELASREGGASPGGAAGGATRPRGWAADEPPDGASDRYVDGVDLAAAGRAFADASRPGPGAEGAGGQPGYRGGDRGFDLPSYPNGEPAPGEEGYADGWGLDDESSMEEAVEAYAAALARYDALHGPPMESGADEARLKAQRAKGIDFVPLYAEAAKGEDVHSTGEEAWAAFVRAHAEAEAERAAAEAEAEAAPRRRGGGGRGGGAALDEGRRGAAEEEREDCGYPGITEAECVEERGCRWDETRQGVPWCFV